MATTYKPYIFKDSVGIGTASVSALTDTVASWAITSTFAGVLDPREIYFKPDGTKMFLLVNSTINQYTLSTPWDITTAGSLVSITNTWDTASLGMFFSPDGTKLVTCGQTAVVNAGLSIAASEDRAYYLTLSSAWDISSTITLVSSLRFGSGDAGLPAAETAPAGITFNSDGTIMYMIGSLVDAIYQYTLSTAYNVGTATYSKQLSIASVEGGGNSIEFNTAGTRMYITGSTDDAIVEYRLSTAWDIATAVYYDELYVAYSEATPQGIFIDEATNSAYMVGTGSDLVTKFSTNSNGVLITPTLTNGNGKIDLVGDTRIKTGNLYVNKSLLLDGGITLAGSIIASGNLVANQISTSTSAITLGSAVSTGATAITTNQTSGAITIGGVSGTGNITVGQATTAQTLNLGTGATAISTTKAVNIGTSGVSGSISNIIIGSATAGTDTTLNASGRVAVVQPTGGIGTVSNTASGTTVTGVGTLFTRTFQVGDSITIGAQTVAISAIASDTSMTTAAITNANTTVAYSLTGGTRFVVNSNGNVGIGTTNPSVRLDVVGASNVSATIIKAQGALPDNNDNAGLYVLHQGTTGTGLRVRTDAALTGTNFAHILVNNASASINGLQVSQYGTGYIASFDKSGTVAMRIDTSGNVGIGTTSPSTKLHVAGTSAIARIDRTADASANPELQLTAVARQFNIGVGGATFATAALQGSYYLYDATAVAYRFVINSSGNFGIGTDTGSVGSGRLNVVGGRSFFAPASETYAVGVRYISTGGAYYFGASNGTTTPDGVFSQAGGSERMRITDAGNVGIGTSSPIAKLDVVGSINFGPSDGSCVAVGTTNTFTPGGGSPTAYYGMTFGGFVTNSLSMSGYNGLAFYTNAGLERMRIDSSGNVGIGTSSPGAKLDVRTSLSATTGVQNIADFYPITSGSTDGTYGGRITLYTKNLNGNYWPAAIAAINDAGGSNLSSLGFYTAAAGPTLVERMRIDSSGNVGVGITPANKFDVYQADTGIGAARLRHGNGNQVNVQPSYNYYDAYNHIFRGLNGTTESMRIDASGNVGIGTNSPRLKLDVSTGTTQSSDAVVIGPTSGTAAVGDKIRLGFALQNTAGGGTGNTYAAAIGGIQDKTSSNGGALGFYTQTVAGDGTPERMRINSAGQLCLGTTSALNGGGAKLSVQFAGGQGIFIATEYQGAGQVLGFNYNVTTNVGSVNITATTTSYATSSDYRLKNVTGPITTSGAYIDSLNPVEGTWKVDGSTFVGLVAHEVQAVSRTEIVNGEKDGEVMQAMDYSSAELIANLIAEVKALRIRVATLESNAV